MLILYVVKGLGLGGAERLLVGQVIDAVQRDIACAVAYVRPDKDHFVDALVHSGASVASVGDDRFRPWPLALVRLIRRTQPDVVHSHSPLPAAVARLAVAAGLAGAGAVHVYTEHNRWSSYRRPTRWVNAATMALDGASWAVSAEAQGSVAPARLRRRVTTLHHGIDRIATEVAARPEPDPGPPGRPPSAFTYVHVANRRPDKAHGVLLDAFARAARIDPELRLWLVGQRLDEPDFEALVARHPARDRIEVLGYRADAPALVARADALVLSSDHEGLPVAVMEALVLGRPVVSTAVGGVPEAIRHGREGLLVAPRDPVALATAMVRLHREPGLHARLAAEAEVRGRAFDAGRAHDEQIAAYRRLARPPR